MNDNELSYLRTNHGSCFLCGSQSDSITQEHVFPKWLQKRYDLWNKTLGLLNETKIQYRALLIPCCPTCNQEDLSRLENTISVAVSSGYLACSQLDKLQLYLWAGKLYFGILRKEISLSRERSNPQSDPILPNEALKSFSSLHLFLQGIRQCRHEMIDNIALRSSGSNIERRFPQA